MNVRFTNRLNTVCTPAVSTTQSETKPLAKKDRRTNPHLLFNHPVSVFIIIILDKNHLLNESSKLQHIIWKRSGIGTLFIETSGKRSEVVACNPATVEPKLPNFTTFGNNIWINLKCGSSAVSCEPGKEDMVKGVGWRGSP